MNDLEKTWEKLITRLESQLNNELSLKGILYLIGLQELNMVEKDFSKEEKVDVLHVAICKVLCPYGYYKFSGIDKDGWPHYEELKALKSLSEKKQEKLIKTGIIKYLS